MTDDSLDGLDFDRLNTETTAATTIEAMPVDEPASAQSTAQAQKFGGGLSPLEGFESDPDSAAAKSKKWPFWEIASILGGVFLVVGLFAWILMAFVFARKPEEESTLELPRNRMEAMLMELPVGEVRSHHIRGDQVGSQNPTVFIVEIDASIIVFGTSSEFLEVEALLKSHHSRIEEVIEETVRSASDANLNEPDVTVIRTRIRDRINEFFGRPLVKEVLFGHYRAFHTPIKMGT